MNLEFILNQKKIKEKEYQDELKIKGAIMGYKMKEGMKKGYTKTK